MGNDVPRPEVSYNERLHKLLFDDIHALLVDPVRCYLYVASRSRLCIVRFARSRLIAEKMQEVRQINKFPPQLVLLCASFVEEECCDLWFDWNTQGPTIRTLVMDRLSTTGAILCGTDVAILRLDIHSMTISVVAQVSQALERCLGVFWPAKLGEHYWVAAGRVGCLQRDGSFTDYKLVNTEGRMGIIEDRIMSDGDYMYGLVQVGYAPGMTHRRIWRFPSSSKYGSEIVIGTEITTDSSDCLGFTLDLLGGRRVIWVNRYGIYTKAIPHDDSFERIALFAPLLPPKVTRIEMAVGYIESGQKFLFVSYPHNSLTRYDLKYLPGRSYTSTRPL